MKGAALIVHDWHQLWTLPQRRRPPCHISAGQRAFAKLQNKSAFNWAKAKVGWKSWFIIAQFLYEDTVYTFEMTSFIINEFYTGLNSLWDALKSSFEGHLCDICCDQLHTSFGTKEWARCAPLFMRPPHDRAVHGQSLRSPWPFFTSQLAQPHVSSWQRAEAKATRCPWRSWVFTEKEVNKGEGKGHSARGENVAGK